MLGAMHLLVQYKGSRRADPGIERNKKEARERAQEAANAAAALARKHRTADALSDAFGELVVVYTDEPGAAARRGNLGRIRRGSSNPDFERALVALKPGQVSDAVETVYGFHVILRTH
jgi:parvulin-like peptidyl-prolyl isomerase